LKILVKGDVYTWFDYWLWINNSELGGGYSDGGGQYYAGGIDTALSLNDWQFVFMSMNETEIKFYIDGTLVHTESVSGSFPGTTDHVYIGCQSPGSMHLPGGMDEIRVRGRMCSLEWVNTSYMNQVDPDGFVNIGSEKNAPSPNNPPVNSNPSPSDEATGISLVTQPYPTQHQYLLLIILNTGGVAMYLMVMVVGIMILTVSQLNQLLIIHL